MFLVSKGSELLEICFSATLENVDTASKETKRFLAAAGIQGDTFDILLVMREGLTNAVIHGSQMNKQKSVKYRINFERHFLTMEIEDEGSGFDWRTQLGKKQSYTSDRGRGLAIMKEHFEDVRFNDKGNSLLLMKMID
jgi:serine/threonine-protein kinase RsbW